jgi:glycosyltransferase involved in cell wall biosynthesis
VKIFAAHDGGSGCCWYRITMPLQELAKHDGFEVTFADAGERDGRRSPVTRRDMEGYDVIVGQRLSKHEGLSAWRGARTPSSRLVYEIDDDVWTINAENWMAYHLFNRGDIQDAITHGAQVADLITVSTARLAEVMAEATGNRNIAVLPNHVPGWVLDMQRMPNRSTRPWPAALARPAIGWQGGASHGADVDLIADPVRRFLKRFPDWDLRLAGTDYRPTFKAADRAVYSKWVRVNDDPRGYYETMDFDIGLAPLLENKFNLSKSPVKAIEYNALGIPVLASAVEPYRGYVKDGVNGFLIRYEHDWLKRMTELASDDALRARMSEQSRQAARIWTIEQGYTLWADAYRKLFS